MNAFTSWYPDLAPAVAFAANLHSKQIRKGTSIPYISHLLAVAAIVLEHGGNRDEVLAALLHDSIEDQGGDYPGGVPALRAEIEKRFGPTVLAIVEGCTDADTYPKPPWRERKKRYIDHLASASPSIRLVSCADKLHNARCIAADYRALGDVLFSRFTAGKEGTLWYYRQLADAFVGLGPERLGAELSRAASEFGA